MCLASVNVFLNKIITTKYFKFMHKGPTEQEGTRHENIFCEVGIQSKKSLLKGVWQYMLNSQPISHGTNH